jgi:hypothetical protein
MAYDTDKIDDMVLALLYLTISEEDDWDGVRTARTWKSYDWDTMDRLHEKGYISDPKRKAKSVVLSPEGLERAEALFEQYFAVTVK